MIDSGGNKNPDLSLLDLEGLRRRVAELEQAQASLEARETRYRDLIENARDMIWTVDLDGNVTFLNSACEKITGYTKQELLGKGITDLIPPSSLNAATEVMNRKWQTAKNTQFEIQIVAKNGIPVDLEINSAILQREGSVPVILAIARDISERKLLQDQLHQSHKLEAVGRLAGGIAHDFNNLLTVISGYSQLLLNRVDTQDPTHSALDQIRQSAERAAMLTRQLLAFSRRQPMEPELFDLGALVCDMEKMLRRLIGEHIELVTKFCEEPCRVMADPGQIEQVVMNLTLNARDAMPSGGAVSIETYCVELTEQNAGAHRPGKYAVVRVSDTGAEIDNVTRSHIFEPFFTTKRHDNSGLGLSAVYGMVEQNSGFTRVTSQPSGGAAFDVCLPLLVQSPETPLPEALGGDETILVVEDEEGVLKLIAETLSAYGYTVVEAKDSNEALAMAYLENVYVDLLLTDIVMPKINGRRLADAWRLLRPDLKVLYMSGYTDHASVGHLVGDLGDQLLQKPFSGVKLAQRVREALNGRPG